MRPLSLDYTNVIPYLQQSDITGAVKRAGPVYSQVIGANIAKSQDLGWLDIGHCAPEPLIRSIEDKAKEVRERADIFLLLGVGGSNQGARAVIEAFHDAGWIKVIYAGNNLSPAYMNNILREIRGKSVYVNIIAKNFETLEPGIAYRIIRKYLENAYGPDEAGRRTIATGSLNNSGLERLGRTKGCTLMPFPLDIGGRFSVLSAVGLMPIAAAGIDIRSLLSGAADMQKYLFSSGPDDNPALLYAVIRNMLLSKGKSIEILSHFEPILTCFSKWWIQLYGESEGKDGKGIYPAACSFTEDLHSLGQYIQQGQRILFETFIHAEDQEKGLTIHPEERDIDGFAYLDGKDFAELNQKAYEATVKARHDGGVPSMTVNIPQLTPYYMGQLIYFFEFACFASGLILGVNPFDQPGVEGYKANMFKSLGKKHR